MPFPTACSVTANQLLALCDVVRLGWVFPNVRCVLLVMTWESVQELVECFYQFRVAVFDQMTMSDMVNLSPMKIDNEQKVWWGERFMGVELRDCFLRFRSNSCHCLGCSVGVVNILCISKIELRQQDEINDDGVMFVCCSGPQGGGRGGHQGIGSYDSRVVLAVGRYRRGGSFGSFFSCLGKKMEGF